MLSFSPVVGIRTLPTPHPQASLPPPPFGSGGRGTLDGERGVGRVPIPTRGHTLWYSIRTLWCNRYLPSKAVALKSLDIASAGRIGGRIEDECLEAGRCAKPGEDEAEAEANQQHVQQFHSLGTHFYATPTLQTMFHLCISK